MVSHLLNQVYLFERDLHYFYILFHVVSVVLLRQRKSTTKKRSSQMLSKDFCKKVWEHAQDILAFLLRNR